MQKMTVRVAGFLALCGTIACINPVSAWAATGENSGPGLASGGYVVTVEAANVNISKDNGELIAQASQGSTYQVVEDMGDGYVKVQVGDVQGYMSLENASIREAQEQEEAASDGEAELTAQVQAATDRRGNLVNYALQFVGGKYRAGGTDPNTGVDCSGFTRYVMQHGAGVTLNHGSAAQSTQGVQVSADQMRPGDLICYGNGKRINHVAMYIGNGQIVHASTYKTGIKISTWNYRNPVKIINVLGD